MLLDSGCLSQNHFLSIHTEYSHQIGSHWLCSLKHNSKVFKIGAVNRIAIQHSIASHSTNVPLESWMNHKHFVMIHGLLKAYIQILPVIFGGTLLLDVTVTIFSLVLYWKVTVIDGPLANLAVISTASGCTSSNFFFFSSIGSTCCVDFLWRRFFTSMTSWNWKNFDNSATSLN